MKRFGKLFIGAHLISARHSYSQLRSLWMSMLASLPARRCLPIAGLPCAVVATSQKPFLSLLFSPSFSEMPGMKQGSRAPPDCRVVGIGTAGLRGPAASVWQWLLVLPGLKPRVDAD